MAVSTEQTFVGLKDHKEFHLSFLWPLRFFENIHRCNNALGVELQDQLLSSALETFVPPFTSKKLPSLVLFSEIPYLCRTLLSV